MAIHAVIPAAGLSRRMGRPKLTLDLGGRSVITRLLSVLDCDAIESTTIVHRRADAELDVELQSILAGSTSSSPKVQIVTPEIDPPDMRASVEIALDSIRQRSQPRDDDAWLLVPADHPILEPDTLAELLAAWRTKQPAILIPTHAGQGGHPTLFRWSIASEVSKIPLDQGINWLLRDKDRVLRFAVASDSVTCDLDTPEDYERLLARLQLTSAPGCFNAASQ